MQNKLNSPPKTWKNWKQSQKHLIELVEAKEPLPRHALIAWGGGGGSA